MSTIDGWLEGFMHGPASLGIILLVSLALGLRHASDPDHLAAVTTLIASEEERGQIRQAGLTGLVWGLGHGTTLVLVGLPLVLFNRHLPETVQQVAGAIIGAIIIVLALQLLLRWRRGLYHIHAHDGEPSHSLLHSRSGEPREHSHPLPQRTPISAYGIGFVHGIGGSAGLTLLLLSTISDQVHATGALLLFAGGQAVSMAVLSIGFGVVIARGPLGKNFGRVAPVLGCLSLAFGVWYTSGALGLSNYPF